MLSEVIPGFAAWPLLGNVGHLEGCGMRYARFRPRPKRSTIEVDKLEIRRAENIATAFERLPPHGVQALYVCPDPLINSNRVRIGILALGLAATDHIRVSRIRPSGRPDVLRAEHSGLVPRVRPSMSDKILRGAKAGELPVEQPTKFELVVNLTVAKALGLKLAGSLLCRVPTR